MECKAMEMGEMNNLTQLMSPWWIPRKIWMNKNHLIFIENNILWNRELCTQLCVLDIFQGKKNGELYFLTKIDAKRL